MERINQEVPRWYRHALRMSDERLAQSVCVFVVIDNTGRGKPNRGELMIKVSFKKEWVLVWMKEIY